MARRARKKARRTPSNRRKPRIILEAWLLRFGRWRQRWMAAFMQASLPVQTVVGTLLVITLWFVVNGIYQVMRKPSELFFPVSGALYKTPSQTWRQYAPIFKKHSTAVLTADLLAALAQVEGSGNPLVRTYWRWSLSHRPFEIYRPASSAVGMYQITDGTFALARRYCIHDHVVVEDGPWHEPKTCWFNSLYSRVVPSHAVELTSAYLDRGIATVLARQRIVSATLAQKQDLAAVMHLCGAAAGARYARRGFRFTAGQRCGAHDARAYIAHVNQVKRIFTRMHASAHSSYGSSRVTHCDRDERKLMAIVKRQYLRHRRTQDSPRLCFKKINGPKVVEKLIFIGEPQRGLPMCLVTSENLQHFANDLAQNYMLPLEAWKIRHVHELNVEQGALRADTYQRL